MTDAATMLARAKDAAAPHLPPFCEVVRGCELPQRDPKTREIRMRLAAVFTFPGATGEGWWREDLRDLATVAADDYDLYQRLKAEWLEQSMTTTQQGTLLTTAELAARWGISEVTLRAWRSKGTGPKFFKPGGGEHGHVRYRLEDIEAWEAEHTVGGEAAEEPDDDPTPWCHACGAMEPEDCPCGPIAENH